MGFKHYLSQFIPKTKDEEWNEDNKTVTEIFNMQFLYLMKTSRLSQNRDPVMIHSDQSTRTIQMLLPLLNTINELVTGPSVENREIICGMDPELDNLIKIMTRIVDDIEHDYIELKNMCIILVLSLCEGSKESVLKYFALKTPPSIIANQLQRMVKKIYIERLISNGNYLSTVKKAEKEH